MEIKKDGGANHSDYAISLLEKKGIVFLYKEFRFCRRTIDAIGRDDKGRICVLEAKTKYEERYEGKEQLSDIDSHLKDFFSFYKIGLPDIRYILTTKSKGIIFDGKIEDLKEKFKKDKKRVFRKKLKNPIKIKTYILRCLTKSWQSTNMVKKKSGINWYRVDRVLHKLCSEGKIEIDEKPDTNYWRLKSGKQ